jgi:hypothetical protein
LFAEFSAPLFSREAIAQDALDLVERGWVQEEAGVYQVTQAGHRTRQEAEELTNRLFFAPWSCLNQAEIEDLSNWVVGLRNGLDRQTI